MGVTAALMAGSAAISAIGSVTQGIQENQQAKQNAAIYQAQAKNIATQQNITAEQYRTKQNVLRGQAITTAARGGLKISGSTANSISQSIMQLQMDNSYEQYNLQVKKNMALENARLQRQQGKNALWGGFMKAGQTALTAGYQYNQYWGGNNSWFSGSGTKLSGGFDASSNAIFNPTTIA
jgi:hypothetical protein